MHPILAIEQNMPGYEASNGGCIFYENVATVNRKKVLLTVSRALKGAPGSGVTRLGTYAVSR